MPYSRRLRSFGHHADPPPPLVPLPPVKSLPKLWLLATVAACVVVGGTALGGAVHVAPAAAASPGWKALLNDWYDGRIDRTYQRRCYQEALKHLPPDVETYSSARDDIQRALQSATARSRKAGQKIGPNTLIVPPGSSGGRGSGGSGSGTTTGSQPVGRKPAKGLSGVADDLNPGSASSVPVPLLVLGALAILLVAAGAAGLVAKRVQARRQSP